MQNLLSVLQEASRKTNVVQVSSPPKSRRGIRYIYPRGTNRYGIGPFRSRGGHWSSGVTGLRNKLTKTTILKSIHNVRTNPGKTFFIVDRSRTRGGFKKAFYGAKGNKLTGFLFSNADFINNYFVKGYRKKSWHIYDRKGKKVLSNIKRVSMLDHPKLIRVEDLNGNVSLYDEKTMAPSTHTTWDETEEIYYYGKWKHIMKVEKAGKAGVYDKKLKKLIIPIVYEEIDSEDVGKEPFISANDSNNKITVFDMEGNVVIPPIYNEIEWWDMEKDKPSGNWLVPVEKSNRYGLYNFTLRRETIPVVYDWLSMSNLKMGTYVTVTKNISKRSNKSVEGLIGFVGGKIKQILPIAFVDMDIDKDGVRAKFKFDAPYYEFDLEGRPTGVEGGHKLIKDIFKYVSKSI